MPTQPDSQRVAAIVPVYRAEFLADALESVFQQSRPADEVIVIDDGSPDQEMLEKAIAPWKSRITLMRQPNAGAAVARNCGVRAATSDFVAFLDADDRWFPDFLRDQLTYLAEHPDVDVVYTDGLIVGHSELPGRTYMSMCPSEGEVTLERLLAQKCNVLTSAVVARRESVLRVGLFDESLRRGQDFDLWLRLAHGGSRFAFQRRVLTMRRVHDNNLSGTRLNELERALHIFEKALRTMALTERERGAAERRVRSLQGEIAREHGKARLASGDFQGALLFLDAACRQIPGWKLRAARLGLRLAPNLLRRVYLNHGERHELIGTERPPHLPPDHAAQEPLRKSVSATSTLLRSARLIAGQFFSQRSNVFHE